MTYSSSFDRLYDTYWNSNLRKAGTRYERLSAFVFKVLYDSNKVVHDIKLIGESEVKHQIDVTIEENSSKKKRILIECKDFDVSGDKVGLGIVRGFWGVIDDVHPDEAIIITCNGFTTEAMKYAKNKGIKLAVLREFKESDWDGRIKTIRVRMHIMHITEPKVSMCLGNQDAIDKLLSDMQAGGLCGVGVMKGKTVFVNLPNERIQFNEYIERITNEHPRSRPGPVQLKIDLSGSTIEVENRGGIPIDGVLAEFEVLHAEDYFEVTSDKVAKLVLADLSDSDLIVFEQDLEKMKIDENTGEIIA